MWFNLLGCMVLYEETHYTPSEIEPYDAPALPEEEVNSRAEYLSQPIRLFGQVVDEFGSPLALAKVEIQGQQRLTDEAGNFEFNLMRHNASISIVLRGHQSERFAIHLAVSRDTEEIILPPIPIVRKENEVQRIYFAGDVAMGRRFLEVNPSPFDVFPMSDSKALIDSENPIPGSKEVTKWMVPYFELIDMAVVNLESVVTDSPQTPHPTKDYVYFTLPESLVALKDLGIDYVSLGNNHLYDYQEQGLVDTFTALDSAGILHSGAGLTPESAWQSLDISSGVQSYTLISACSISGEEHEFEYVASEEQGGAADLRETSDFIQALNSAENPTIVMLHMGIEYADVASEYTTERVKIAIENDAALVVTHHPHVTQSWGQYDNVLTFHSLGNFIFDQDRMETMLGMVAEIDIHETVVRARGMPVYLEDYSPKPVVGSMADRFLLGIDGRSRERNIYSYSFLSRSWVDNGHWSVSSRTISLRVPLNEGVGILDLRAELGPGEYLKSAISNGQSLKLGVDLLLHGEFEDYDVDDDSFEAPRWDLEGGSRYLCTDKPYRGVGSLCISRSEQNESTASAAFRNRARVEGDALNMPNKELSVLGYRREADAGPSELIVSFMASAGERTFGEQTLFSSSGGVSDWALQWSDIDMPDDSSDGDQETESPRALRLMLEHQPPERGQGILSWDDLAIISWSDARRIPSAVEFIRVNGQGTEAIVELQLETIIPDYMIQ